MRRRLLIATLAILGLGGVTWTVLYWSGYHVNPFGHSPGVSKLTHLHGLSADSVFADLGRPSRECEFALGDREAWVEFRIELHNFYRPENPNSAGIRIRECRWDYESYHVAVWLHCVDGIWAVLDTCRWPEGVEF